jgi:PKD repeat protein
MEVLRRVLSGASGRSRPCTLSELAANCGAVVVLVAALVLVSGTPLRADFQAPRRLTSGVAGASQTVVAFDLAHNIYVVSVVNEGLQINLIGPGLEALLDVPGGGLGRGDPDVATNARGETYIVFTQVDPDSGDVGREVFLTRNSGGRFTTPVNLSRNRVDDGSPRLALDIEGSPHAVWTQSLDESGESTAVVYSNASSLERVEVARGAYPSIHVDIEGTVHVVYTRGGDVFYNHNRGGAFTNELEIVHTPGVEEFDVTIRLSDEGRAFVCYEGGGELYFLTRAPDREFEASQLLDSGGVSDPEMRLLPGGGLSIVYSKQGDIYFYQGLSSFLIGPNLLGESTAAPESRPSLVIDPCGVFHAAFLRGAEVFYTNNAEPVEADFEANVVSGEAPLSVEFQDRSSGKVQLWRWDFGDGGSSTLEQPVHVYHQPGPKTVTLTVYNADRSSSVVRRNLITVLEPTNVLRVPNLRVVPGEQDVWFPVIAKHRLPVMAFQVHGVYDREVLSIADCSLQLTATVGFAPEVWACNHVFPDEPEKESFEIGCVLDLFPPFDDTKRLPPAEYQAIAHLILNVSPDAVPGTSTEVRLVNDPEVSPIFNIFTIDNVSVLPALESARVEIVSPVPAPVRFIRGDVDGSGVVEITDAIVLLNFLFLGGRAPRCMDAADLSDAGRVDISGAISVLNYLFLGGAAPRVPFPNPGIDPTDDNLGC